MLICIQADHNFMTFSNAFISEHWEISPRSFWVENCFITGSVISGYERNQERIARQLEQFVKLKKKRNGYKIVFSWRSYAADKEEAENKWAAIWKERNNLQYFHIICFAKHQLTSGPLHNDASSLQCVSLPCWFMSAIPSGLVY